MISKIPIDKWEEKIDNHAEKILTNPLLLRSVSMALNMNAYRKLMTKKVVRKIWSGLDLPGASENARLLHEIEMLNERILDLEKKQTP